MTKKNNLFMPVYNPKIEALQECIDHLQQTWTDNKDEYNAGLQLCKQFEKQIKKLLKQS
jgi:peptidoglycan hydrolase CwlO-like protein